LKQEGLLEVRIGRIQLENPLILASGILGTNAEILCRLAKAGFAAVTTKSIGPYPNEGHPGPNVIEVPCGFINAIGLRNPGIDVFSEEIKKFKKICKKPLIVSIYANDTEGYGRVAKVAENSGADVIEVNVSCPHSKEKILNIGLDARLTAEVIEEVKKNVKRIPIFIKLPGNTNIPSFLDVAKSAIDSGIDGFVAINTLPAIAIDIEIGKPILGFKVGGLSGPAIKHVALRLVYELRKVTDLPIIGVGGITNYRDVLEFIATGANAVQIGSAIGKYGTKIIRRILRNLTRYLEKEKKNITDYFCMIMKDN